MAALARPRAMSRMLASSGPSTHWAAGGPGRGGGSEGGGGPGGRWGPEVLSPVTGPLRPGRPQGWASHQAAGTSPGSRRRPHLSHTHACVHTHFSISHIPSHAHTCVGHTLHLSHTRTAPLTVGASDAHLILGFPVGDATEVSFYYECCDSLDYCSSNSHFSVLPLKSSILPCTLKLRLGHVPCLTNGGLVDVTPAEILALVLLFSDQPLKNHDPGSCC